MGKLFHGNAAWLNDTEFGALLEEIGRFQVKGEPKERSEALIMRVNAYADMLADRAKELSPEERKENLQDLRTSGWLRDFFQVKGGRWHGRLARFVRGAAKHEQDKTCTQQSQEIQIAA